MLSILYYATLYYSAIHVYKHSHISAISIQHVPKNTVTFLSATFVPSVTCVLLIFFPDSHGHVLRNGEFTRRRNFESAA